jgi:hypothetical protein
MPHLVLRGNHVPEQRAEGHGAEEGDYDEGERRGLPDVKGHQRGLSIFVPPKPLLVFVTCNFNAKIQTKLLIARAERLYMEIIACVYFP